jgi:hypothetical protein
MQLYRTTENAGEEDHLPSLLKNLDSSSSELFLINNNGILSRNRHDIYEHTRKHTINKIVHQTDLKGTNILLKQTSSLRRSQGYQKRLKRI